MSVLNEKSRERLEKRAAAIRNYLEKNGDHSKVLSILDAVDSEMEESKLCKELSSLKEIASYAAENESKVQALIYEWYYGGSADDGGWSEGYLFDTCKFNGEASMTDLFKLPDFPGSETEPEMGDGVGDEFGGISLDVMTPWYELAEKLEEEDAKSFWAYSDAYNELFLIKLCTIMRSACEKTYADQSPEGLTLPFHIFISLHERWPLHVYTIDG